MNSHTLNYFVSSGLAEEHYSSVSEHCDIRQLTPCFVQKNPLNTTAELVLHFLLLFCLYLEVMSTSNDYQLGLGCQMGTTGINNALVIYA